MTLRFAQCKIAPMDSVWVFNGKAGQFPSAIFSTLENAEFWISKHRLTGMLTKYPIDVSAYEWAVSCGAFKPTQPYQAEPTFIQRFTSASQEHYHYENGANRSDDP